MSFTKTQARLAKLTVDQLQERRRAIEADPKNRNQVAGSIWLYTPAARRKLDAIAWAITFKLAAARRIAVIITALVACGADNFARLDDSGTANEAHNDAAIDTIDPPLDASDARTDDAKLDAPPTDGGADTTDACSMISGTTACGGIMNTFCTALFNKCGGSAPQTCVAWWAQNFPADYDCSAAKYKKQVCADDANKCANVEIPSYMCGKLQSSTPGQLGGACASFFAGF